MPIGYTERGFADYAVVADGRGATVRLRQSSSASVDALWLFVEGALLSEGAVAHLEKPQVEALVAGLRDWLADADRRSA